MSTFGEYVERYWHIMTGRTSPRTFKNDTTMVRTHLVPFFKDDRLESIKADRLNQYVAALKQRTDANGQPAPLAPSTINFVLRMMRKILLHARDSDTPVIVKVPKMPFQKEATLHNEFSAAERAADLAAFDDEQGFMQKLAENRVYGEAKTCDRYKSPRRFGASLKPDSEGARVYFSRFQQAKLWFLVALHTGLRRGDVTQLKRSAVNMEEGFIRLPTEKTGQEAAIPISNTLRQALAASERQHLVPSEFVIVTPEGKPYADSVINDYHRLALAIAGIKRHVRVHDLRHSFGSACASASATPLMLKSFFGHTTTKMSERYSRPSEDPAEPSSRHSMRPSPDQNVTQNGTRFKTNRAVDS